MRTTLTLDDDVAAQLEKLRSARKGDFKRLVNDGLRQGLRSLAEPKHPSRPFQTGATSLGRCLLPTIDDVSETLAIAEGEGFR